MAEKKSVTIIVNAAEFQVEKDMLSFGEITSLAFETPPYGEFTEFTVTYRRGHGNKPEGTLPEGGEVKVKEGMIFNVTATDES